jgi:hypothetical protein
MPMGLFSLGKGVFSHDRAKRHFRKLRESCERNVAGGGRDSIFSKKNRISQSVLARAIQSRPQRLILADLAVPRAK